MSVMSGRYAPAVDRRVALPNGTEPGDLIGAVARREPLH
jgi:hypothetical protein